jgi:hypothetical protein
MTTLGGAGTFCKRTDNFLRARHTGIYHRVGASTTPRYGAPALRSALRTMGERPTYAPPSHSLVVSKHTSSVKKSSIWSRKKSPIWGMCSGPPRDYNLINRQAGLPLRLPLPRAARLFSCSAPSRCPKPSPGRSASMLYGILWMRTPIAEATNSGTFHYLLGYPLAGVPGLSG